MSLYDKLLETFSLKFTFSNRSFLRYLRRIYPYNTLMHCNSDRIKRQNPSRVNDGAGNHAACFFTHAWNPVLCERGLTTNFELKFSVCRRVSKTLSVRTPEKRSHHSFVNISPTLVIDTSMERSSRVLQHRNIKIWFFFLKTSKVEIEFWLIFCLTCFFKVRNWIFTCAKELISFK